MMKSSITNNPNKSPPQRLWKALNQMTPQKVLPINRKKIRTRKQVSFSDQLLVVPTAVCLSEAEEDFLWWTEDEIEIMIISARAKGELDSYREGLISAQYKRRDVLKEQDRLRQLGQSDSDWNPLARVSRKGSMDSSWKARRNGIEIENSVFQDSGKLLIDSAPRTSSRYNNFTRRVRSRFFKVRPTVFESSFESNLQ